MSKKFSAMDAATKMGQFGFGYGPKIQSRNPIKYFILAKQIICYRPLQVLASLYLVILYIFILYTYISSLVLMNDYGRKRSHFSFKGICGLKANN